MVRRSTPIGWRSLCAAYNAALVRARRRATSCRCWWRTSWSAASASTHSERELHIGEAYSATAQAIPPGPQYVALGHIHAPQPVPGTPVPAEYAGSLLPLDFGEAGETKRVVMVDAEPGAWPRDVDPAHRRPAARARDRAHGTSWRRAPTSFATPTST